MVWSNSRSTWSHFLFLVILIKQAICSEDKIIGCGYPGNGRHSLTNITEEFSAPGTTVEYTCEEGFWLIGPGIRICNEQGEWHPKEQPLCLLNVAEKGEVLNVSRHIDRKANFGDKGINIIDGDIQSCSSTTESRVKDSNWTIDLREVQNMDILILVFEEISDTTIDLYYGINEDKLIKIEDSEYTVTQMSIHSIYLGDYKTIEKTFHKPKTLRYLRITISPTEMTNLKLCEVKILSKSAISKHMCSTAYNYNIRQETTDVYNSKCYTFVHDTQSSWLNSNEICDYYKGTLVSNINKEKNTFLQKHLQNLQHKMKFYWIGGYHHLDEVPTSKCCEIDIENDDVESSTKGRKNEHHNNNNNNNNDNSWYWIQSNHAIEKFFWGYDQPTIDKISNSRDSYCINLAKDLTWRWNDDPCKQNLSFICEYEVMQCGIPDRNEYSGMFGNESDYSIGTEISYNCPKGYRLEGNSKRVCESTGQWSGIAPRCHHKDTQHLQKEENGSTKTGVIIGIVLIVAAVLIIIIIVVVVCTYKKKRSDSKTLKATKDSNSKEALDASREKPVQLRYSTYEVE